VLEKQPEGRVVGVLLDETTPSQRLQLGGHTLDVSAIRPWRNSPTRPEFPEEPAVETPHGIFVSSGPDEIYLAGAGLTVRFSPVSSGEPLAGLATVEEGAFVDGRWQARRVLAGDDTDQGNSVSLPGTGGTGILRVLLYKYR
jgi:hypothetical protein